MVPEISPQALRTRLSASDAPLVLDVREDWERDIVRLPGTRDIPMGQITTRLAELPREREIVVLCRSGGRSLQVAQYLGLQGFRAANLTGGILAWARDVDPSLPTY
jgi:rhodanese-related sulfurtransferase